MDIMPKPEQFFFNIPLYKHFEIDEENYKDVLRVEFFKGTIDSFCVECKREGIFQRNIELPGVGPVSHNTRFDDVERWLQQTSAWFPSPEPDPRYPNALASESLQNYAFRNRIITVEFNCSRNQMHNLLFIFQVDGTKITKIGQYPSLADLQGNELRKYRPVLTAERFRELNRAVGLKAHGVGIGSFVYLRRIIEELIDEAHSEAVKDTEWDEELYSRSRVVEKIQLLAEWLPSFLVENRITYSILSKGIHSLNEQECLDYFDAVKVAIELILDEKIQQQERQKKITEASQNLGKITGEMK